MTTNDFDKIVWGVVLVIAFAAIYWGVMIVISIDPFLLVWGAVILFFVWECVKEYKNWKNK